MAITEWDTMPGATVASSAFTTIVVPVSSSTSNPRPTVGQQWPRGQKATG